MTNCVFAFVKHFWIEILMIVKIIKLAMTKIITIILTMIKLMKTWSTWRTGMYRGPIWRTESLEEDKMMKEHCSKR